MKDNPTEKKNRLIQMVKHFENGDIKIPSFLDSWKESMKEVKKGISHNQIILHGKTSNAEMTMLEYFKKLQTVEPMMIGGCDFGDSEESRVGITISKSFGEEYIAIAIAEIEKLKTVMITAEQKPEDIEKRIRVAFGENTTANSIEENERAKQFRDLPILTINEAQETSKLDIEELVVKVKTPPIEKKKSHRTNYKYHK